MASLDSIIDAVCENAGADFAFVLTRRGRLVTKSAPADMPEVGRMRLVRLAEEILEGGSQPAMVEIPRQALVPYGGATPVDVYVAAREEAILCAVMATYNPKDSVVIALLGGLEQVDELLSVESDRRARRRGAKAPPAAKSSKSMRPPGSSRARGRSVAPPPMPTLDFDDGSPVGRATIPMMSAKPTRRRTPPPPPPEIAISEAPLGRATLAAIEIDAEGPEITYGVAPIGRATIAEIELSAVPRGDPRSSLPSVQIGLASMPDIPLGELEVTDRQTLPFTENAADAKRSFEARQKETGGSSEVVEANSRRSVVVGKSAPRAAASADPPKAAPLLATPPPRRPDFEIDVDDDEPDTIVDAPGSGSNPRDSGLNVWHQALTNMTFSQKAKKPASEPAPPKQAKAATVETRKRPGKK